MNQEITGQPFWLLDEPKMFWDVNPKARCIEFCNHVDSAYYEDMATMLVEAINATDDEARVRRLDTALRFQYLHAQETLFTSLLALIQAPFAVAPYFSLLKNNHLFSAVEQITQENFIGGISLLGLTRPSWKELSRFAHMGVRSGSGWNRTTEQFAEFWESEARFYLSDLRTKEYNALKHCARVSSGPFGFHVLGAAENGDPTGSAIWEKRSNGAQGSQFSAVGLVDVTRAEAKGRHLVVSHQAINWDRQTVSYRLQLLSSSIANVIVTLKSMNGANDATMWFRPEDACVFDYAKVVPDGMADMNIRYPLTLAKEHQYSGAEIRKLLSVK
jgi:hypothetical protein